MTVPARARCINALLPAAHPPGRLAAATRLLARAVAAATVVVAAAGSGATASATPARDELIRPGVGIGTLRLGVTLPQARRALGGPIRFVRAEVFRGEGRRYLEYRTRDGDWTIGLLGSPGRERLVRVWSFARRERTREGVGVGTLVPALPARLRALRPECRKQPIFINYREHPSS